MLSRFAPSHVVAPSQFVLIRMHLAPQSFSSSTCWEGGACCAFPAGWPVLVAIMAEKSCVVTDCAQPHHDPLLLLLVAGAGNTITAIAKPTKTGPGTRPVEQAVRYHRCICTTTSGNVWPSMQPNKFDQNQLLSCDS